MKLNEELFLDHKDKINLMKWQYKVTDHSITTELMTPYWNWLLTYIPTSVAPNVLTLCGLMCILNAAYLCSIGLDSYPFITSILVSILIFASQSLDAIDGKQARKIKNGSPIGELFDHAVDATSTVFLCYMIQYLLDIEGSLNQWCLIQTGQLLFLHEHLKTLISKNQEVIFERWSGSGEVLLTIEILFLVKAFIGSVAIEIKQGVTNPDLSYSQTQKKIIDMVNEVILLADYSKFGSIKIVIYF